jgi:hypothetical protein
MKSTPTSLAVLSLVLAVTASGPLLAANNKSPRKSPTESATSASKPQVNDFPTQARVEYVQQCMAEHGGTNLDNMYHCVCAVDKIASLMNFEDYSESLTLPTCMTRLATRGASSVTRRNRRSCGTN